MAKQETHNLIGSNKVEGTKIYDLKGNDIGAVEKLMIEKSSGRVSYAVVRFGDFFGLGGHTYPLPWDKLTYDEELDGYHLDVDRDKIDGAPKTPGEDDAQWTPDAGKTIYTHYGILPYWTMPHVR
jgi:sporulation protein YlmC with PRC-barrel domain